MGDAVGLGAAGVVALVVLVVVARRRRGRHSRRVRVRFVVEVDTFEEATGGPGPTPTD